MRPVLQHLVLAAPAVLQTHIQVSSLSHQSCRLFERRGGLAVECDDGSLLQSRLHLRDYLSKVVVAEHDQIVESGLLIRNQFLPGSELNCLLALRTHVQLLHDRVAFKGFSLRPSDSHALCSSNQNRTQQNAFGLLRQQHSAEGSSIEEKQCKHFPANGADGPMFLREVVLVERIEGDWFRVDSEHILAFLLLQVFLLGVLGALAELLVVLDDAADDLAGGQLLLHPGDVLGLQALCLLQLENLPVVVCHLLFRVLLGLSEMPGQGTQLHVGHFELGEVRMEGDLLEGD